MIRYDPTDSMEEVRHGSYVLFEEANKRIEELEEDRKNVIKKIEALETVSVETGRDWTDPFIDRDEALRILKGSEGGADE